MKQETLNHFKELFTNIIEDAQLEDRLYAEALLQNDGGDLIDQALGDREKQLALKLKGRQGFFIKKVKVALEKIDKGTFGTCDECSGEISTGRLLARPTATLCITCKEEQENNEQHIPYQKKSHTHGLGLNNQANVVEIQFSDKFNDTKQAIQEAGQHI